MGPSRTSLSSPKLHLETVQIWSVRLAASPAALERFQSLLCPEEQSRAARFKFEHLRQSFALSRGVLRALLGSYLLCAPESVQFVYGKKGKPAIAAPAQLQFNTSHSGEVALYGFSLDQEIGVDIEQFRPMDDMQSVAARFFSAPEVADLNSLSPDERVAAFFRCWTRKEAYIKATGDGLSSPLDGFRVTFLPHETPRVTEFFPSPHDSREWSLHNIEVPAGYAGALAYHGKPRLIEAQEPLSAEDLLARLEALRHS